MGKNTSVSLGKYFDDFLDNQLTSGRYKNASEVIRAALRLLESEENKASALKNALLEGLESPLQVDFDLDENLKRLIKEIKANA